VEYIVSLGTTGEATSLSDAEQNEVIRHTVTKVADRVPIVAGHFGGNNTAQVCEKLKAFNCIGIAAILTSSPAYVKPSQEGIYQHYMALADASPVTVDYLQCAFSNSIQYHCSHYCQVGKGFKKIYCCQGCLCRPGAGISNSP
jgi:hypothetical protein